jgi:cytochrome b5
MTTVMDILTSSGEVDGKGILETAANLISSTISSLIYTPSTPSVGHASENDNKLNQISMSEISMHDSIDDCWVIIYDRVYDITNFLDQVSEMKD